MYLRIFMSCKSCQIYTWTPVTGTEMHSCSALSHIGIHTWTPISCIEMHCGRAVVEMHTFRATVK